MAKTGVAAADGAPTRDEATPQLIAGGESKLVEFKQTARVNVHTNKRDPVIEQMVVKTVAGFMHAEGGTLLVGVTDTGKVSGRSLLSTTTRSGCTRLKCRMGGRR